MHSGSLKINIVNVVERNNQKERKCPKPEAFSRKCNSSVKLINTGKKKKRKEGRSQQQLKSSIYLEN